MNGLQVISLYIIKTCFTSLRLLILILSSLARAAINYVSYEAFIGSGSSESDTYSFIRQKEGSFIVA